MRKISLTRRLAQDAAHDDDVEITLIKVTHEDLASPVLITSDPTEQLSVDPLLYGTNSNWNNGSGEPFLFLIMSAVLPGDQDDAPAAATITLEAVTSKMAQVLRSTRAQANVDIAVVLASDPNAVQAEWRGLKLVSAEGNAAEILLTVSRDPITAEPWPSARMTRQRFPGMHK